MCVAMQSAAGVPASVCGPGAAGAPEAAAQPQAGPRYWAQGGAGGPPLQPVPGPLLHPGLAGGLCGLPVVQYAPLPSPASIVTRDVSSD